MSCPPYTNSVDPYAGYPCCPPCGDTCPSNSDSSDPGSSGGASSSGGQGCGGGGCGGSSDGGSGPFTPSTGIGSPGNSSSPVPASLAFSPFPIRYTNGEIRLAEDDFAGSGFGTTWSHVRTFSNQFTNDYPLYPKVYEGQYGCNWLVNSMPYLAQSITSPNSLIVMGDANSSYWFDQQLDGTYLARYGIQVTLAHILSTNTYRLTRLDGSFIEFADYIQNVIPQGILKRFVDNSGRETTVTSYSSGEIGTIQCIDNSTGTSFTRLITYTWGTGDPTQGSYGRLVNVLMQSGPTGGTLNNMYQVNYTYLADSWTAYLQTVEKLCWSNGTWQSLGMTYYRYTSTAYSPPGGSPYVLLAQLQFVVHPRAYANMVAAGLDPLTASNSQVAMYADYYFNYDSQNRVIQETVDSGSMTYTYQYFSSSNPPGYNSWATKTIETRPDGNQLIVYCNYAGLVMLKVLVNPSSSSSSSMTSSSSSGGGGLSGWYEFRQYDANCRVILLAESSAVSGYNESYPDLLHNVGGNYQYLQDHSGLIHAYTYHAPTGWLASEMVQQGELGPQILLRQINYLAHTPGSSSSSSSSSGSPAAPTCFYVSQIIDYPDDGISTCSSSSSSSSSSSGGPINAGTRQIITSYSYTWYSGTYAIQQKTTTLPVIPASQNGSGVAATRLEYYDTLGNMTWFMDERGFITNFSFDVSTGGPLQRIDDVDTSLMSNVPAGWTTPSGGGLQLISHYQIDNLGRNIQSLGPSHTIDLNGTATTIRRAIWTVYQDALFQVWTGSGYATGTSPSNSYVLINPVAITISDPDGDVTDVIKAVRYAAGTSSSSSSSSSSCSGVPSVTTPGALTALDSFPQCSYVRWTTYQYLDCCYAASMRVYKLIPSSGTGISGTNYDETDYGYDVMKRRYRTVTPGGTIADLVFDIRGNVLATYVGTDDTGATPIDPTGGGAPGNNMVIVTSNVFDSGSIGGNGNQTQRTDYVDASTQRIWNFGYDFRDRQVTQQGPINYGSSPVFVGVVSCA